MSDFICNLQAQFLERIVQAVLVTFRDIRRDREQIHYFSNELAGLPQRGLSAAEAELSASGSFHFGHCWKFAHAYVEESIARLVAASELITELAVANGPDPSRPPSAAQGLLPAIYLGRKGTCQPLQAFGKSSSQEAWAVAFVSLAIHMSWLNK